MQAQHSSYLMNKYGVFIQERRCMQMICVVSLNLPLFRYDNSAEFISKRLPYSDNQSFALHRFFSVSFLSLSLCRAAIQICHPLPFFMHNAYHLLFTLVYTFSFVRRIQRFECSYVELINEAHDMRTINPVHRMPITKKKVCVEVNNIRYIETAQVALAVSNRCVSERASREFVCCVSVAAYAC